MNPPSRPNRLKRQARELLELALQRYGYGLVRTAGAGTPGQQPESESIPRGRTEPFTTAEYDVLPRGAFDVVPHTYYSPIPDLSQLPDDIWSRRSELYGVDLDPAAGIELLESRLAPFVAEMDVPAQDPGRPGEFFLSNTGFEQVDAELLYAMVRSLRPRRVVELGSGYTTLLIGMAARRNAAEGVPTEHVAYDPYPRAHVLGETAPPPSRLEAIPATDVPMSVFTALEPGDVLFVDTTHTVKLGSDVNFILLEVLPRLQPGVVVHLHDIFLPWEYPRVWFEEMHYYWAEQYLVQAFLAFNSAYRVLLPAQALSREFPERLKRVIGSFGPGVSPASMWLERTASDERPLSGRTAV